MPKRVYTEEMISFIKDNAKGRYTEDLVNLFNKKFNTHITHNKLANLKKRHGIKSGLQYKGPRKGRYSQVFTEDMSAYIADNYKGTGYKKMAEQLNQKFGTNIKHTQIKNYYCNHKLNSGLTGQFEKGHIPQNKGKKCPEINQTGAVRTQFKKGRMSGNHKPVGSERTSKDGYLYIKTKEPNIWRLKHRVLWESANGKVPKGHALIFLDGDKSNINLDNLELISLRELAVLNKMRYIKTERESTRAMMGVIKIKMKLSEIRKGKHSDNK